MKNIIILFLIGILITGCNDAMDSLVCYNNVKKKYPNSTIYRIPNKDYIFIIQDSNKLYQVKCMNLNNAEISETVELESLNK